MPRIKYARFYRYLQLKKLHGGLPEISLCDECKSLGYCKAFASDAYKELHEVATSTLRNPAFDLTHYTAKIPFRVDVKLGLSEYAKVHLQTAYDAFHQDDYETALLHFKSVAVGGSNYLGADYFLALSYFMLGNYQMADGHMQACGDNTFYRERDFNAFLDECSRRSAIGPLVEEQAVIAKPLVYPPDLIGKNTLALAF